MNYNLLTEEVERRLSKPRYELVPISSIEVLLQYGCSARATEEPLGYPMLRMNNLQAGGWELDDLKYVELAPTEFNRWRLEVGDIVFNRTNSKELVGKCEVFEQPGDWVFASYLMRLRVDSSRAVPEFITAFLATPAGRTQIDRESRQIIGMSNINAEEIRTLRIPLPATVKEQEQLLAPLRAGRIERRKMLADAKVLLEDLDAFVLKTAGIGKVPEVRRLGAVRRGNLEGPLNPERYLENSPASRLDLSLSIALNDAFDLVEDKVVPSRAQADEVWNVLRIDDLGPEPLDAPQPRRMLGGLLSGSYFRVREGDLLVARLGPPLLNGKIVVLRETEAPTLCSPEFLVLRPNGSFDPEVAACVLRSRAFRRTLYSKVRGSTPSRYRLISEDLNSIRLPLLSADQQDLIKAEFSRRRVDVLRLRRTADELVEKARSAFERSVLSPP